MSFDTHLIKYVIDIQIRVFFRQNLLKSGLLNISSQRLDKEDRSTIIDENVFFFGWIWSTRFG